MPNTPPTLTASGTIRPCRFVKISGAMTGAEADANEIVLGVSRDGTDYAPISDPTRVTISGNAAIAGDNIPMLGPGEVGLVELGGTVAAGARVKSDADGRAVAVATTGTVIQHFGGYLLQGGDTGHKVLMFIHPGSERPALS